MIEKLFGKLIKINYAKEIENSYLNLIDQQVPASNILGSVGSGYKILAAALNEGRVGIASQVSLISN